MEIKSNLIDLFIELEKKKNEIKDYLTTIDYKILQLQSEIAKIDNHNFAKDNLKEKPKTIQPKKEIKKQYGMTIGMTNEYEYSGDEYDSDDSCDRIYLMDLPKLFENH